VQIYTKYKAGRGRGPLRTAFYWLLVLGGLSFLVWVFLDSGRRGEVSPGDPALRRKPQPQPPAASVSRDGAPWVPGADNREPTNPASSRPGPPSFTQSPYVVSDGTYPRPVANLLEAQVALARRGVSPGSLDGTIGSQTRTALRVFQAVYDLRVTGQMDPTTRSRLTLDAAPFINMVVGPQDLARLIPLSSTWLGKSLQPRLDYETILELVAERYQSHPALIQRLNPSVNWANVTPGTGLLVPNVWTLAPARKAAFAKIYLASKILQAFDAQNQMLAHFPCSIARRVDKRPTGMLQVVVIAPNPNYTFNPQIFPESPEANQLGRTLNLPAGPNNPVGVVWIGLDRPGYGIHGTPRPEDVGRTESHGCFRLANWNAEFLARLVAVGTPIYVEP
jgi:lipoprotein-anchoring transpeptidase ErfK/SrfK